MPTEDEITGYSSNGDVSPNNEVDEEPTPLKNGAFSADDDVR